MSFGPLYSIEEKIMTAATKLPSCASSLIYCLIVFRCCAVVFSDVHTHTHPVDLLILLQLNLTFCWTLCLTKRWGSSKSMRRSETAMSHANNSKSPQRLSFWQVKNRENANNEYIFFPLFLVSLPFILLLVYLLLKKSGAVSKTYCIT